MEELFYKYMALKQKVQFLAGIVQNSGFVPTKEELSEFSKHTHEVIDELQLLEQKVYEYFSLQEVNVQNIACMNKGLLNNTCSITGTECHLKNPLIDICYAQVLPPIREEK